MKIIVLSLALFLSQQLIAMQDDQQEQESKQEHHNRMNKERANKEAGEKLIALIKDKSLSNKEIYQRAQLLLKENASLAIKDDKERSALYYACTKVGDKNLVGLLLQCGANPNETNLFCYGDYESILRACIRNENLTLAQLLLDHGAEITFGEGYDDGENDLIFAVEFGIEAVKLLVKYALPTIETSGEFDDLIENIFALEDNPLGVDMQLVEMLAQWKLKQNGESYKESEFFEKDHCIELQDEKTNVIKHLTLKRLPQEIIYYISLILATIHIETKIASFRSSNLS